MTCYLLSMVLNIAHYVCDLFFILNNGIIQLCFIHSLFSSLYCQILSCLRWFSNRKLPDINCLYVQIKLLNNQKVGYEWHTKLLWFQFSFSWCSSSTLSASCPKVLNIVDSSYALQKIWFKLPQILQVDFAVLHNSCICGYYENSMEQACMNDRKFFVVFCLYILKVIQCNSNSYCF